MRTGTMTTRGARRKACVAFGAAAVVLGMASAAFACTIYRGMMAVTVTPGFGLSRTIGDNNTGSHGYCSGAANAAHGVIATTSATAPAVATITVTPANECGGVLANHLNKTGATQNYEIRFWNGDAFLGGYTGFWRNSDSSWTGGRLPHSCGRNQDTAHGTSSIGTMAVDANGFGQGAVPLPARTLNAAVNGVPTEASAICVQAPTSAVELDSDYNDGNMAPIAIAVI